MSERELTLSEAATKAGVEEEFFPTHLVSFYGIKCFYNEKHYTLWTQGVCPDFMIDVVAGVHNFMSELTAMVFPWFESKGFPLKILVEYKFIKRGEFIDLETRTEGERRHKDEN